ncbi:MAG: hypothetical protein ACXWW5_02710 [Actinomycetota bacterium]
MTASRLARLLVRIVGVIVLVASGAYLLVYLYRWEWNRALISGVFFLIAEVALGLGSLGRRLSRVEERVEKLDRPAALRVSDATQRPPKPRFEAGADLQAEGQAAGGPFPWLEPGSLSVFVPVLLGLGAILSGIAYLIERVATATDPGAAQTAVERRLADLQPPASLIPPEGRTAADRSEPATRPRQPGSRIGVAVSLAVVALLIWTLVNGLAEFTQNRPDPTGREGRSSFDLVIDVRGEPAPALPVAQALASTCRPMAPEFSTIEVSSLGGSMVRLVVIPSLAENARRRFTGCLSDLQLDRVMVHLEEPARDPVDTA